jgi:glycosyltransferase involved in cell wall biosynthesis
VNVAIFTDNDFGKVNGVTTTLNAVLRHEPPDICARIYTSSDRGVDEPKYLALRAPGIGIPFYPEMRMYWPRVLGFLRHARRDRIDLVHYTTPGPIGLAAMLVARQLQVPMVGSFHTQLSEYTALLSGSDVLGNLMREYQRWPYGKCVRVLAPSEATRDLLVAAKIRRETIRLWKRGVDTARFTPDKRSADVRDAWGVDDRRPAVLFVGRLSKEKGLEAVPALSRTLHDAGLPHRLVFVGEGPMRRTLEAECPGAAFTGSIPHEQVAVSMASADLFLFPSRTDTFGNVVLEAQASGLPVVVTDAGGPKENIRDGRTGYVCRTQGPVTLHVALERLLRDPLARATMGGAAREYALSRRWPRALEVLYQTWREAVQVPVSATAPRILHLAP